MEMTGTVKKNTELQGACSLRDKAAAAQRNDGRGWWDERICHMRSSTYLVASLRAAETERLLKAERSPALAA